MKARFLILFSAVFLLSFSGFGRCEIDFGEEAKRYYRNAFLDFQKGNLEESATNYQKAVILFPAYAKSGYNNLGIVYSRLGPLQKAEACFKEAVRIDPNYYPPKLNLGLLYDKNGLVREANRWWIEVYDIKKLKPANFCRTKVSNEDFYIVLGMEEIDKKNYVSARGYFTQALKFRPDYKIAEANMAISYEKEGNRKEALEWWAKYFNIDENKPKDYARIPIEKDEYYTNRGLICLEKQDFQQAIQYFMMALSHNANYKPAQLNLAMAFERINAQDEANKWWVEYFDVASKHQKDYMVSEEVFKALPEGEAK